MPLQALLLSPEFSSHFLIASYQFFPFVVLLPIVEQGLLKINGTHSNFQVNTDGDNGVIFVDKSLDY